MRRDSAAEPPPAEPAAEAQSAARPDGQARPEGRDGRDERARPGPYDEHDADRGDSPDHPRGLYDTPRPHSP
ncbi:hypothetical protein ABGB20_22250, partial [Streptomyces sp. B22F1]